MNRLVPLSLNFGPPMVFLCQADRLAECPSRTGQKTNPIATIPMKPAKSDNTEVDRTKTP